MSKYIVHIGTGTILDAEDGVYVLDDADLTPEPDEDEFVQAAFQYGEPMTSVLKHSSILPYAVLFTPDAIRTEVRERVNQSEGFRKMKEWVAAAPDYVMERIATDCINDEMLWEAFQEVVFSNIYYYMTNNINRVNGGNDEVV